MTMMIQNNNNNLLHGKSYEKGEYAGDYKYYYYYLWNQIRIHQIIQNHQQTYKHEGEGNLNSKTWIQLYLCIC